MDLYIYWVESKLFLEIIFGRSFDETLMALSLRLMIHFIYYLFSISISALMIADSLMIAELGLMV